MPKGPEMQPSAAFLLAPLMTIGMALSVLSVGGLATEDGNGAVTRLGCFQDGSDRDLPLEHQAGHLTTRRYCLHFCRTRGHRFAGLQSMEWCFCGNSYGRYERVDDGECSHRCKGNVSETCGGPWRNEVFTTGVEDWESQVTSLGCFVDTDAQQRLRDLPAMHQAGSRTAKHYCWNFCRSKGYRYFGMQNKDWCSCGNSYGRYGTAASRECNLPCAKDARETCGGVERNQVFTTGIEDWETKGTRLGCFQDRHDWDLPLVHHAGLHAARQHCWHFCHTRGYKYFGLQAKEFCTCGNSHGRYGELGNDECQRKCSGDAGTTCGDYLRNEVFTTGVKDWANGVAYLGCYEDSSVRDLPFAHFMGDAGSKYYCQRLCLSRGYRYFGMQAGAWCSCGNTYGRYRHVGNGECSYKCAGDATEACGGALRNSIFSTGFDYAEYNVTRLGCFTDREDERDLPLLYQAGEATSKPACFHYCKSRGYRYFGLQAESWCSCGHRYGRHGQVGDARCHLRCKGSGAGTTCGGDLTNAVFTTGIKDNWEQGVIRLGCFADGSPRDLPVLHHARYLTYKRHCWTHCRSRGHKYFGLQNGDHCACGDTYGRHGQVSDAECNSRCTGDSSVTCGGALRNEVFTTGVEDWDTNVSRLGCFKDNSSSVRDLALVHDAGVEARKQFCWHFCHSRGYKYFGVQFKRYCSCGNSYGRYGQVNDSECSDNCMGSESGETCGAELRNEIFTTGVEEWEAYTIRLGCFEERPDRDLPTVYHAGQRTSKFYCWRYCRSRNYQYFGLHGGSWCTCGHSYGRYSRLDDSACSKRCLGDPSATCGGAGMQNELFTTGFDHWEIRVTRLGCFKDNASDRDLSLEHRAGDKTRKHYCWHFCWSRGFKYFGMQAREYCYCGNTHGRYGLVPDGECRAKCLGDETATCGAELRNEVFDTGIETWEQDVARIGCFNLSRSNLPLAFDAGNQLTKKFCWNYCRSRGYRFFGLQARRLCNCGNSQDLPGNVDDEECNERCRGDSSTTCGAELRNEVFGTGIEDWERKVVGLGCFLDSSDRDLPLAHGMGDAATKYNCWKFCSTSGYRYFGLQERSRCFCGNSYGRYGRASDDGQCSEKCAGDDTTSCGGEMKNQVFTTGLKSTDLETGNSSLGCFKDSHAIRDLPLMHLMAGAQASRHYCRGYCKSHGYRYFGLQASQWCSCGNSYGRYGPVDEGDCNQRCLGDSGATCGAYMRNEVFATTSDVAI